MSDPYFRWAYHHAEEAACACDCQARAAAFAAGIEIGLRMDAYAAAMHDATHLATVLQDRRTVEALRRLLRFVDWATDAEHEVETLSAYWRT